MHRKYFYVILALTGLSVLVLISFFQQKPKEVAKTEVQAIKTPYTTYVTGVGIIEPKSGNIYIGIPFNRIIKQVNVAVNDKVKKGDILIQLDDQDLISDLKIKKSLYEKAQANLNKLEAFPQKEDLTAAEESLNVAQEEMNEAKSQYDMVQGLSNPDAISKEEQEKRLYKFRIAEAQLKEKQAQYDKIKSGAWKPDLEIARQEVKQALAEVEATEAEIHRTIIKSPIDGTVLQVKIHEGETADSDPSKTVMVLGNLDDLYVRVSVDQLDVPYIKQNAQAVAYRQGDHEKQYPLKFIHIEPFVVPKQYLTNTVAEKVDTQVLEVLYKIEDKDNNLYIGEQMDVFINAEK